MKQSLWSETVTIPSFPRLEDDLSTDVLIIGGGLCGLLCGYYLKKAGVDYAVLEGSRIASGITRNTTAKITSQHGLLYDKLLRDIGEELARQYLESNQRALDEYEKLSGEIDCDFEKRNAYVYSVADRRKIEQEVRAVNRLGFPAVYTDTPELPFKTEGAICFPEQAQFHPLKFLSGLVEDMKIYEQSFVSEIMPHAAITNGKKVRAKIIIITTHFPFINKHGAYFLKLYQHRSYVSAFRNAPPMAGMYVDCDKKGLSFRSYQDFLIIGGGGHRTGKKSGTWEELSRVAGEFYPEATLAYQWAAQDCMSLDGVPYIGRYSGRTDDVYVASGFNKWGMTSSMVAAMILSDMVLGRRNDFASVYAPGRSILKPQLAINGLETALNLLAPRQKRCPHLGCALRWNQSEHSWDCPCHGSRFTEAGRVIDNPATGDLKKQK